MFPMDRKPIPVAIEYDGARGKRLVKRFGCSRRGRSFYVRMEMAGKRPRLLPPVTKE